MPLRPQPGPAEPRRSSSACATSDPAETRPDQEKKKRKIGGVKKKKKKQALELPLELCPGQAGGCRGRAWRGWGAAGTPKPGGGGRAAPTRTPTPSCPAQPRTGGRRGSRARRTKAAGAAPAARPRARPEAPGLPPGRGCGERREPGQSRRRSLPRPPGALGPCLFLLRVRPIVCGTAIYMLIENFGI